MNDSAHGPLAILKGIARHQYVWGIAAIVLLLVVNLVNDPGYLAISISARGDLVGNSIDILRAAAPIMMIAVGMCLVVATKGIDLSVGSVMVVAGAVSMEFLSAAGAPDSVGAMFGALGLVVLVSGALGAINATLVSVIGLQPFISTLVLMLAGRGLAKVITGGQNTSAQNEAMSWIANGRVLGFPVIFIIALAIVILVGLLVRRSALGLMLEAIGMDAQAARLAGVNRRALLFTVYILSGVLAGIAGVFATSTVMTVDVSRTGYQLELDAILAVVIGGTSLAGGKFNITGATIGALLIATLDKTVVYLGVDSAATPAFKAVIIVALVLLQSERVRGAFRRRRITRPQPEKKEEVAA
ncbi:ABC transporter permease [Microbacterium karelineae]|uniref:ABC transporter permease n=1 Tax=Microbacterium karelineae TaxID=2654283 RepID=UPI0012EA4183|nr:ABC transporter permease [Microbacterium karelineae]